MEQSCLGNYGCKDGCDSCAAVFLCIDVALEVDGYFDQLASWIEDAEEIEAERREHGEG